MDRFLVRSTAEAGTAAATASKVVEQEAKRFKRSFSSGSSGAEGYGDPKTLVSWNVNGLVPQLRKGGSDILAFVRREQPDLLCLQEVRVAAAGPRGCKRGDGQRRRRGEAKQESKQEKEEWRLVEEKFIAALATEYRMYWSLADWKYSGTALLVRRPLMPAHVGYTLPSFSQEGGHMAHHDPADPGWHPEGRIILASFESFDVLTTYAPNNGNDEAAFARRAAWDTALLQQMKDHTRPMLWIGDLNCAPEAVDVSHPDWFAQQMYQGDPQDMRGQPGFTEGERRRHRQILEEGKLFDTYRRLHPMSEPPPASGPYYTWRGHPPVHQPVAKYHGKGMRIDHCLLAEELLPRLEASDILGHGEGRMGFMGSDHSPIRVVLREAAPKPGSQSETPTVILDISDT